MVLFLISKLIEGVSRPESQYKIFRIVDKSMCKISYEMKDNEKTIEREFGVYKTIDDNYPKYVISLDDIDLSKDGIIHLNLIDFLLKDEF